MPGNVQLACEVAAITWQHQQARWLALLLAPNMIEPMMHALCK